MRCFASHKKARQKKPALADQDAAAVAKMTRTLSAPPTFLSNNSSSSSNGINNAAAVFPSSSSAAPSPMNPQAKNTGSSRSNVIKLRTQQPEGSASPLITHSGSIPSGYNSLSGLRRDSMFRGQPLPLPTPESCGLPSDNTRFMPSPAPASKSVATAGQQQQQQPQQQQHHHQPGSITTTSNPAVFTKSASMPLPRPPAHERLASAHIMFCPDTSCIGESGNGPAFSCTVSIDAGNSNSANLQQQQQQTGAVLIRLADTTMQDSKAWIEHVKELACLRDAHLSRILGFSFSTEEKLVVYELQANGSLDRLLYGRTRDRPPLDWCTRVRIATDAARGLAFLHERSSNKLMFKDFRTFNVHVDKNFRARLMGYGFTQRSVNGASPMVAAYAAPELISGAAASTKSNVWSFGVVLLEILTGRQNRDEMFPPEEQDLVAWTAPYLNDETKLFRIVDPELKGMFPAKSVAVFARAASRCLLRDSMMRARMDEVVQMLEVAAEQEFEFRKKSAASGSPSDSRKPLIEALKECSSPARNWSPSATATMHPAFSAVDGSTQKRLVTRLVQTFCSSAVASE